MSYRPSELHALGVQAKKSLSQNFLIDGNIIQKLLNLAAIERDDAVLEVGPGIGAITEQLVARKANVTAIEKDNDLFSKLSKQNHPGLTLHHADALDFPLESLKRERCKLVANLPFRVATPLLTNWLPQTERFESFTIIIQKEVGLRMCAKPDTRDYSSLSLFIQAYSTPKYGFTIQPSSFYPPPKVHCCAVHLTLKPFPFLFSPEEFFILTRTAFGKRRKMLRSSLKELYSPKKIEEALMEIGKNRMSRPQELSLEEFGALFSQLQTN